MRARFRKKSLMVAMKITSDKRMGQKVHQHAVPDAESQEFQSFGQGLQKIPRIRQTYSQMSDEQSAPPGQCDKIE